MNYDDCQHCIKHIKELGGDGNITVGGSWYTGTKGQIEKLIQYMAENEYDFSSMAINESPKQATNRRIDQMKKEGLI